MCGEMILASAAKCRFCGEVFDSDLKQAGVKKKKKKKHGGSSRSSDDDNLSAFDWSLVGGSIFGPFLRSLTGNSPGGMFISLVLSLSFCIGIIVSIVYMAQGKRKGLKMFGLLLLTIVIVVAVALVIGFAMVAQQREAGLPPFPPQE
jgi:hypothetical protein